MGVVIKQSFWGTVIAYIGVAVGYLNTLYFRAEYFDLDQIGLFQLITANAMMVSPIASFGMGSSFIRFFPSFHERDDKDRFFSFLFLITVLGNVAILFVGYLFKDAIALRYIETAPTYIDYISVTAIIIVSNSLFELFFSYSRMIMKVIFPSFLRDIYLRLGSLLLVIGFALEWWSFNVAVLGLGLVYLLACAFLLVQLLLVHQFRFNFSPKFLTKEWINNLLKYGSYAMVMAGSFAIVNNVTYDQITAQLGFSTNAIYATCFFIATIVEMPRRNMTKVLAPVISLEFSKKNMSEVASIYKRGSITMTILGMLIFIGIVTNLEDLFDFIPKGSEFETGFWVVVGVCATKLALMVSSFCAEIISYSHLYKFNLIFQVISALLLIVLNYFLISLMGLNGAVISYVVTILLHSFFKVGFVWYHFKMHPFIPSHFPLFIIGTIAGVIAYFFQPTVHPVLAIVIRSILTTIIFVTLIYRFRISEDINKLIHSTFERFLKINLPK